MKKDVYAIRNNASGDIIDIFDNICGAEDWCIEHRNEINDNEVYIVDGYMINDTFEPEYSTCIDVDAYYIDRVLAWRG